MNFRRIFCVLSLVCLQACNTGQSTQLDPTETTTQPTVTMQPTVAAGAEKPEFISDIWPEPNRIMPLKEYQDGLPGEDKIYPRKTPAGVGVEISPFDLDHCPIRSKKEILESVSLTVDGQVCSARRMFITDELALGHISVTGEDGRVVEECDIVGGPYSFSCLADLMPGSHDAVVQVLTKSGDIIQYQWTFILEDD